MSITSNAVSKGKATPVFPVSSVISTCALAKTFRSTVAVSDITLEVPTGEVFGFLGPNGAGKTTVIKMLVGLIRPSHGLGYVLGAPLGNRSARRQLGYLPELFRYQDWLSAWEVCSFHATLAGIDRSQLTSEIKRVLAIVDLLSRAGDRVGTFSKGMQQRLGLAIALLGHPRLVLLDEPTSALDPVGRHQVREIIRQLRAAGTTVFLNSHLLSEVELVCERIAVINHGRIIMTGKLDTLLKGGQQVRIRATGVRNEAFVAIQQFATLQQQEPWFTLTNLPEERIPEVVSLLVRTGARVYSVEICQSSLEEHFLRLLGGSSP